MPARTLVLCTLAALLFPATHTRAALVAHWKFDEAPGATTAVASFGGINGALSGNAAFVTGGKSGNAISTTIAGNGFVNFGNNFGFVGTTDFSVSAWVKLAPGDTVGGIPVAKHFATQFAGYILGVNDIGDGLGAAAATNKAHFYVSGPFTGPSTTTVNDGAFHLLTGVYHYNAGSPTANIFVDGTLQNTASVAIVNATTAPFLVGGIQSASAGNPLVGDYNGLVDDVQLYNHALTPPEVLTLFNNPGQATPEPTALLVFTLLPLIRRPGHGARATRTQVIL